MATDWVREWVALDTVTSAPDAGKELQIGDEDAPNDVVNRTSKQINGWLEELAASGLGNNIIPNGSFETWSDGISNVAPSGFTLKGTPTDVSRDTGERDGYGGAYASKITSNGSGNEGLTVTFSGLKASTNYFLAIRAKATAGDTARIWTTGGSTNLDENTASTTWVTLSGLIVTDATPANIVLNFGSDNATDIVWFDKLMIQEGEVPAVYSPQKTQGGAIVQIVNTQTGAETTGTTTVDDDDTKPQQSTDGDQYMTLAITPTKSSNQLKIDVVFFSSQNTNQQFGVALYQDATEDAIAAAPGHPPPDFSAAVPVCFTHFMTAGTTSVTTFKVFAGVSSSGTMTFNGVGGAGKYDGVIPSSITITEITTL